MNPLRPGAHERHLLRRKDNPLFAPERRVVDAVALAEARRRDQTERDAFERQFRTLLEAAASLKASEESEVLLELKARLDQAYTLLASLAGAHEPYRQGLRRLTDLLVNTVRRAVANDPLALAELDQEQMAREQHYRLLESPLVADLMRSESPVAPEDLAATLLSASAEELGAALWLFAGDELTLIEQAASALLEGNEASQGVANLALIRAHLGKTLRKGD